MTINQALIKAVEKLQQNNIPAPHLDAEILLSYVLKKSREYILTHPEKKITKPQISNTQYLISRRAKHEPIAYITGHKQFYGLDFFVNKHVLIPRPETELMVEEALKHITHNMKQLIIDVGTGSGCIIITLAKFLNLKSFATDISKPALTIARKNAKLHKVDKKITFLHGNLLEPIIQLQIINQKSAIIILANLPYLTPTQIRNSASIQYEPKLALNASPDGLKYYRQLFKQIHKLRIADCGLQIFIEINPNQTKKIKHLIRKEMPKAKIQTKKDLMGHNRLIITTI